ncbi:MAG: HEAT repeat domain-containing protein [Deltaproteobacteria bacterium]|nr:HEAT repeat domain-containing protein [Deltaproteobacteria bacterium]
MAKHGTFVERLSAVCSSESGRWVSVGGQREGLPGSAVHVLSLPKLTSIAVLPVSGPVRGLARLSGDTLVALTANRIVAWEMGEQVSALFEVPSGPSELTAVASDVLGAHVAVGSADGSARVYRFVRETKPRLDLVFEGRMFDGAIVCLALENDTLVAGSDTGRGASVGFSKKSELRTYEVGEDAVTAVAFTGDGRVAFGRADGAIFVAYLEGEVDLENRTGELPHAGAVRGLTLGPELEDDAGRSIQRKLFSAAEDGLIRAWSLSDRKRPKTLEVGSSAGVIAALSWIAAAPRAKKKQGQLAVVTKGRRLGLIAIGDSGELGDELELIESELERVGQDLSANAPGVREAALNALGEMPEDDARKLIERALLGDKKPELRAIAAKLLSSRRRSRDTLVKALGDGSEDVRKKSLESLFVIDADAPMDAVRSGLSASAEGVRLESVGRLPGLRARSPLVPGLLAGALGDAAQSVRMAALDGLSAIDSDPVAPLQVAIDRGAPDVRSEALVRLWLSGRAADSLGRSILGKVLDDGDSGVRERAFHVALLASPPLAQKLSEADKSLAPKLEELSKRATATTPGPYSEADSWPLSLALSCRAADSALRAAKALSQLGDARAVGALLQLSREAEPGMRLFVVMALEAAAVAMPSDERLRVRLLWLLDDSESGVRSNAYQALSRLAAAEGPEASLELAESALRAAQPDVRARAVESLAALGKPGAAEAIRTRSDELLSDALDDETPKVRSEAFRTLWSWHSRAPEAPLRRGAACRHPDIKKRVVETLEQQKGSWVRPLLLTLVSDPSADVGRTAYGVLTKSDADKKAPDVHLAAMSSPRPEVRAAGAKGAAHSDPNALKKRVVELVEDPSSAVHLAAIESLDKLAPTDEYGFRVALGSVFYELRVRAGELLGKRRDGRCTAAMTELLSIPKGRIDRPSDGLRQRAARALADVGDPANIPFLRALLDDEDPLVREMGARGLATASRPGNDAALADALGHEDLAVRSWAAEGLSRLGDVRALPVLAGTQAHTHRPIRVGAILGFVALGSDGVRGILKGLEDPDREVQDLVLAVIVARDLALLRAGLAPDLLYSALAAAHPEVRFAAARALEARLGGQEWEAWARELVGPRKPEKAADAKGWPDESKQTSLLNGVVRALASAEPGQRYAAAQVLALRPQPESFWREAERLSTPAPASRPWIPSTNFSDEKRQARKKDWVRRLFARGPAVKRPASSAPKGALDVLAIVTRRGAKSVDAGLDPETTRILFGTYAGLVRQTPAAGETDEGHRVRRDSIGRISAMASAVGFETVEPILLHAISDPHHLVRRAAVAALTSHYPPGSLDPLRLALASSAADVGRPAFDEALARALQGEEAARALAISAIDAPSFDVRAHAAPRLERLWPKGSLDPWLTALSSRYADVRLNVVDRLLDVSDARVSDALVKALESDHEDLRQKAAVGLARRGDLRTIDVLSGLLRSRDAKISEEATEALVTLARASSSGPQVARVFDERLSNDPDKTADRPVLIRALGRVGDPSGRGPLLSVLLSTDPDNEPLRGPAADALLSLVEDKKAARRRLSDGRERPVLKDSLALELFSEAMRSSDAVVRARIAGALEDVESNDAEAQLAKLTRDRDPSVRIRAVEAIAFRAEHMGGSIGPLESALLEGRRELVLPAASGLASKGKKEAFQALMLVLKAGQGPEPGQAGVISERERAILALGTLADPRALPELSTLVAPTEDATDDVKALAPSAAEAMARMLSKLPRDRSNEIRETVESLLAEGRHEVQRAVLSGLAFSGDDKSRAKIEQVASDPESSELRRHALTELGKLANAASEPVLAHAIADDDSQTAEVAVRALGRVLRGDKTKLALAALDCPHEEIAGPAARFLAERGEPETLARRLPDVKMEAVRRRLTFGLLRRGGAPTSAIEAVLGRDDASSRASGAWIAGATGDKALAKRVVDSGVASAKAFRAEAKKPKNARDENLPQHESAWRNALWAAARLDADAQKLAKDAAEDAEAPASVRIEATRVLARNASSNEALLTSLLSDSSPQVREAAAFGLGTLGKVLEKVPAGDASRLGQVATRANRTAWLASVDGRRALLPALVSGGKVEELIAAALATGESEGRIAAIRALGRLGGDAVKTALEKILANPKDPEAVRKAAFSALRKVQRAAAKVYSPDQDQDRGPKVRSSGGGSRGGGDDDDEGSDDDDSGDDDDDSGDDDDDSGDDDDDSGDDDDDSGDDDDDSDDDDDDSDDDDDDSDDDDDDSDGDDDDSDDDE